MKRRYIALLAIIVPILLITLLNHIHPVSYNILMGYMAAVVLIFKSSLTSLWLLSKLKIIAFIKSLTLVQAILLGIKRWFIDNMLSEWLKKYIFDHLNKPFKDLYNYYRNVSFKVKIKNFFMIFFPLLIGVWVMYATDMLTHVALFVELKVLVIGFFKALWVILGKLLGVIPLMISWISGSWLAPILEVFALSYLLSLLERFLGPNNLITRFFNYIGDQLNTLLERIGLFNDTHIEPIFQQTVAKGSQTLANKLSRFIRERKIREEYLYFDNFQNIILRGHINAYYSFPDMDKIKDKRKLYQRINEKTRDNIDIIAYVSRNGKGEILEAEVDNNFYHDIFLLKGIASHKEYGVQERQTKDMDATDFWVLNTSQFPVYIKSHSGIISPTLIQGHEVKLIKTKDHVDFNAKDLYFEYQGVMVYPTTLDEPDHSQSE